MAEGKYILDLDIEKLKKHAEEGKRAINSIGDTSVQESKRIESSFKGVGSTLAKIGIGITLGEMARGLYNFSANFDKAMREVATISKVVGADMDGTKEKILDMTTEIPIAAGEATKALYQIISAGHDGADGMKVLEVAAKTAIGGVTDTATAADAITTLLNAYKLSASDAQQVSDMLFTTVKLGKTDMSQLGKSISQVAPIAASFGIEMEQVLAAVASLTKSGTPTAQAMTQVRASIVSASKVLGDGYFATHSLQEGLAEIAKMARGSESELRKLIPEIEGMNGVLGLTGLNAQTAASDLTALGDSAGATAGAFEIRKDEASAQVQILKNNALKYFSELGDGIMDSVSGIAGWLNKAFESGAIERFSEAVLVLVSAFGVYKAAVIANNAVVKIQNMLLAQAAVQKKLAAMAGHTLSNTQAMAAARTTLLSAAKMKLVTALKAVRAAMLSNPWTAALVAITTVVTAIVMMKDSTEAAKEEFEQMSQALDDAAAKVTEFTNRSEKIQDLANRYDELKRKTSLSKDETYELSKIVELLAQAFPSAISRFDQFGNAAEISTGKINRAIEAQRQLILLENKDLIDEAAENAAGVFADYRKSAGKALYYKKELSENAKFFEGYNKMTDKAKIAYSKRANIEKSAIEQNKIKYAENTAAANKSLELTYAYIKKFETQGLKEEEMAERMSSYGINTTVSDVRRIKQEIEKPAKLDERLGEVESFSKSPDSTYAEDYEKAKTDWEKAKANLARIEADKDSYTTTMMEGAKKRVSETKKVFDALGGEGITSTTISKEEKEVVEGSIAWYEERIKELQEKRSQLTNAEDIAGIDVEIADNRTKIEDLDGTTGRDAAKSKVEAAKAAAEAIKAEKEKAQRILEEFATFEQKRLAIANEYKEKREALYKNGEKSQGFISGAGQGNIDNINADEQSALASLNNEHIDTLKKGSDIISQIFDQTAKRTTSQLNILKTETQGLITYLANTDSANITARFGMSAEQLRTLKSSPEQLEAINKAIDELYDKGAKQNPFAQLAVDAKKLFSEDGFNPENLEDFSASLDSVTSVIGNATSGLADMFTAAGNEEAAAVAEEVGMAISTVSNVANGFAQGGLIGGISAAVSETIGYITMAFEAAARHQAALAKVEDERIAQQKEYNSLLREQNLLYEQGETIFGSDAYGKAANGIKQSKEDAKNLSDALAELKNVQIVTGHEKTGLFGWGKGKDTYTDILDLHEGIIDSNGNLDIALANSILASQNLSDEHRKVLEDAIEAQENYEESIATMNDYLGEVFGSLGNTINDILVDCFRNSTDAGLEFVDAISLSLETLASDFAYSMAIAPILAEAQKAVDAINRDSTLTEGERANKLQALMMETGKSLAESQDDYNAYLQAMVDGAAAGGYDLFKKDDSRTSASADTGIAQASQDSITELNGRATAIQGHTFSISESTKLISQQMQDLRRDSGDILKVVTGIKSDTSHLPRLESIESNIGMMRSDISSMNKHIKNL